MPRFTNMLADGMIKRGHKVEIWRPEPFFNKFPIKKLKKWMGYIDQYIFFSLLTKWKIRGNVGETLYVITDNALGPYVPLVKNKPHIIHCHDFLAQNSALGKIPENITSRTGKKYQQFIRNGYIQGNNFISVSEKTRYDLEAFLPDCPTTSEMVYNGLNPEFKVHDIQTARAKVGAVFGLSLSNGYFLHVGGNQWYKNRTGILSIYEQWRKISKNSLPLIFVGQKPDYQLHEMHSKSLVRNDVYFFSDVDDDIVKYAYSGATVFLFPSLAEGFGWPIAEAMASGTLVLTTNEAPMLEVAGDAAFLIDKKPSDMDAQLIWAKKSALVLEEAVSLLPIERKMFVEKGIKNVKKFNLEEALNKIEAIYLQVIKESH